MRPALKSRRGMTLAELMVAMAMVAVMIVMVVSFVSLITGRTRVNGENLAFQQDFAAVKAGVEGWMSATAGEKLTQVDPESQDGESPESEIAAIAIETVPEEGEEKLTLRFQNGVLSGGDISIRAESVGTVTFQLEESGGEYLLFCTVTRADSEDSYTFCVDPRVEAGGAS